MSTLDFYKVGISFENFFSKNQEDYDKTLLPCITYPMFYPLGMKGSFLAIDESQTEPALYDFFDCENYYLAKVKVRAIGKEFKHFQRIEPKNSLYWYILFLINILIRGLFGIDTVPKSATQVIITEGEYDAMAAWQVSHFRLNFYFIHFLGNEDTFSKSPKWSIQSTKSYPRLF